MRNKLVNITGLTKFGSESPNRKHSISINKTFPHSFTDSLNKEIKGKKATLDLPIFLIPLQPAKIRTKKEVILDLLA